MFSKCMVAVDEDVDVENVREVAWKALNNIDAQRDAVLARCDPDVAGSEKPG
jgi:4-hydroxy-3-polyprenylbenzoate decarboxylase